MVRPLRSALLQTWLVLAAACGRTTPEELLSGARIALEAGELRTAEIHAKNLLQQEPNNIAARILLGEVSLAAGDAAAAEQNLRIAESLDADAAALQLPLLRALIAEGKNAEVLAQIERGPQMAGPDLVTVLSIAATAHRGLGAVGEAEATYLEALEIDPRSAAVRTDLAALYAETGRVAAASELLTSVLANEPAYAPAILVRGNIELSTARSAAAEASFREVLRITNGARSGSVYRRALAQVIETQLAQGNVDGAATDADALMGFDERNPQARFLKARVELAQQDVDAAERRLESVVAEFPDFFPAQRLLGSINADQNQLGQAEMYLRAAARSAPQDSATRLLLAEVLIRQGDVAAARELIETTAPSAGLSDSVFLALAGRASAQAGQSELASEFFDESERIGTLSMQELVDVSRVYVAAGEFERAIRVLETASVDEARNAQLRDYLLALIQLRQGDVAGAAASAQRLSEQQPDAVWAMNLRGGIALVARDLSGAREWSLRALELEPNNVPALLSMARVSAASNDKEQARVFFERVLAVNPQEPTALVGLAQLAAERGDSAEAKELLAKSPESAARFQIEGDILAGESRFDAAAASYARAFDLQPTFDGALRAYAAASRAGRPNPDGELLEWSAANPSDPQANFVLGTLALERGDQGTALTRYETVLTAEPNHGPALNNLAWLYGQRGDERALDLGRRAHEAQPENPEIADTLGWLYLQRGDAAAALPLLEQASRALPNQLEVRYHWAVALAETGDTSSARRVLEDLASGASFPSQADARQRLGALEAQ